MNPFAHRSPRCMLVLLLPLLAIGCASTTGAPLARSGGGGNHPDPMPALLPLEIDTTDGRALLTIARLNEPLLYLNTLATGTGSGGFDRGQLGDNAVVRFERQGDRIFLFRENSIHTAQVEDTALRRTVRESFPRAILAAFDIVSVTAQGPVVDATDFLLSDLHDVSGRAQRSGVGLLRVDANRSFIDAEQSGSFPENTEVHAVLTFLVDNPSAEMRRYSPDGRSLTLEQRHSFMALPDQPLALRRFDPRAGLLAHSFFDFSQGFDSDYRQRSVARWRLEPSDTAAYLRGELVDPVRPIVYYLDPGVPEPYRTAFIEGGRWWNEVFQAAGWRNAFRLEPLPAGASGLDVRYPTLYWVHRDAPGPSVGPSHRDPRTGEILSTVVRMDSHRSLVDHDIYMGLVPAAGAAGLGMDAERFAMDRRRQHVAHEIGHTLGLAHNFLAASQGRSSVMDYPYPLIEIGADGELAIQDAYRSSGGAHDSLAIRYAYSWYPDAAAERAGLRRLMEEAAAREMRFITGEHSTATGAYPEATPWVEGENMLDALERTMGVRRLLIERFDERALQPGEPLALLNRRFAHLYFHHRYALEGAIKTIGGMRFDYALAGEPTVGPPTIVPPDEQRRALQLVLSNLQPQALHIPSRIAALIPPVPYGYDADLAPITFPTGGAFDPIGTAYSLAQEIVDNLLAPERAARIASFHSQDRAYPALGEILSALVEATWRAPEPPSGSDPQFLALQRVAQRAVLDGMLDLAGSGVPTPALRATTETILANLQADLAGRPPAPFAQEAGHRAGALRDLERYFAGTGDPKARARPAYIPLPWP